MIYEIITTFRIGDMVRVKADLSYFDDSVRGIEMKVIGVEIFHVGDKEVVQYHTNRPDPVLKSPYNEEELVGSTRPLTAKEA